MPSPQDQTGEKKLDSEVSEAEMEPEIDPYFLFEKNLELSKTVENDPYMQLEPPCSPTEMDSEDPEFWPALPPDVSKAVESEVPTVPVATPCRNTVQVEPLTPSTAESHGTGIVGSGNSFPGTHLEDASEETPIPGELRLSQNAIDLRMHRIMKVDSKGNSKVSEEIRKRFHSKKGKLHLQQLFQSCGYSSDRGVVVKLFPLFLH